MSSLPIQNYDMDPTISGKVLTSMLESRGISLTQAEKDTGIPYDTLRKCLRGEVRMVSLDRILKVCYITDYTIYDYFKMYFDAEQSSIFDKVVNVCATAACPKHHSEKTADASAKSSDHLCPNADYVRQHIDQLQQGYVDKLVKQYESIVSQLRDQIQQLKDSRQIMKDQYEVTIKLLNDRYDRSVKHMNGEIEKLEKEKVSMHGTLDRMSKRSRWLTGILVVENILLTGLFAYDFFNRGVGWFRSFYESISLHNITRG